VKAANAADVAGVGLPVHRHGLTIVDLLAAELVTADGERLAVDADTPRSPP
jgi:hypothetical protein